MRGSERIRRTAPIAAMVAAECTDVSFATISKAALANGMSKYVSVVYSNALASFILLPFFLFYRNNRPPITFSLLLRFFLLSLMGSSWQILFLEAVKLSSPTLASAMGNLIPIFTFLLALITRMESVDLGKSSGQAKCLGAIVAVIGGFIVTLYEGPAIFANQSLNHNYPSHHNHKLLHSQKPEWILGGLLLVIVCLLVATWNIAQGVTVRQYPDKLTIVFFFTLFITFQSAIFTLILETNPKAWILKSEFEILAIVFTGVFGSIIRMAIHTWCLGEKGPVFVAMFKPFGIAIAVFITVVFVGDTFFVGSLIGSVVIAIGFYSVIWGQFQEKKSLALHLTDSSQASTPLLVDNLSHP